jgi:hypothetical protein
MCTTAEFLVKFHENVIFFFEIQFLVGESIVNDVVAYSIFELVVEFVVVTDSICVLDVLLEIVAGLSHGCQCMADFTNYVAYHHDA